MTDFLDKLARDAKETIEKGYYDFSEFNNTVPVSLKKSILECRLNAIIAEVKGASPSRGTIKPQFEPVKVAQSMYSGGAVGISVLTEPKHFSGSLEYISEIRRYLNVPILMKDIVLSPTQLETASRVAANAVLLIQALFDRGYCECGADEMIKQAHKRNLEVLLETHTAEEFSRALESRADLIGINNRDLSSLKVDLNTTKGILRNYSIRKKPVISESGIINPADLLTLRGSGAQGFLIGSSIMMSDDIESTVKEFVNAQ
jgi:indole-3-glycerol phosphate synthase